MGCIKAVKDPLETQERRWEFSPMPQQERASSRIEGRISWFFSSCTRKLGVPLELLLGLQGPALVASGRSSLQASCEGPLGIPLQSVPGPKSLSGGEPGTCGSFPVLTWILAFHWSFHRGVRPHVDKRHTRPLASRAMAAVSGFPVR